MSSSGTGTCTTWWGISCNHWPTNKKCPMQSWLGQVKWFGLSVTSGATLFETSRMLLSITIHGLRLIWTLIGFVPSAITSGLFLKSLVKIVKHPVSSWQSRARAVKAPQWSWILMWKLCQGHGVYLKCCRHDWLRKYPKELQQLQQLQLALWIIMVSSSALPQGFLAAVRVWTLHWPWPKDSPTFAWRMQKLHLLMTSDAGRVFSTSHDMSFYVCLR